MERLIRFRKQIDRIDAAIVRLLLRRFSIASRIGDLKRKNGRSVHDRDREKRVLAAAADAAAPPLKPGDIESIFRCILRISNEIQERPGKKNTEGRDDYRNETGSR